MGALGGRLLHSAYLVQDSGHLNDMMPRRHAALGISGLDDSENGSAISSQARASGMGPSTNRSTGC